MLRKILQDFLVQQAGVAPGKFDDPELKMTDLGLDSLGVVEMLYEVENRYGFQIDEPFRYNTMKFSEVVADIEATIRERNNGALPDLGTFKQ